jgi:hypothetical protein
LAEAHQADAANPGYGHRVGFFDFDHGQTGRAKPRIGADGKGKVFELHPVTEIVFDNEPNPD